MAHSHHHHIPHVVRPEHARLMRLASAASLAVALSLLVGKSFAWWLSDSMAMLSSLTDSLFDVLVSAMNMAAVRYALKPADDDHRFGHTAIEDIVGLAQFAFIKASMLIILLQSFERLSNPEPLAYEMLGMAVSAVSMLLTLVLVVYQTRVARATGSLIIAADRMHYVGDILFNGSVMLSLFLGMRFHFYWADPAFAIGIALCIMASTFKIGQRAYHNLMGREMPDAEKEKIIAAIMAIPNVLGHHNVRTRFMGTKPVIQMHVDMPRSLSFDAAHELTEQVEHTILALYPHAEVIVHPDPVG